MNAYLPSERTPGTYASVNGIDLYYEVYGSGQPLILLHGGLADISIFDQLRPALAEKYRVIAVDLQAHGHTPDVDRPMTYEHMADDIAALIRHLQLPQVDLLGFSLGGGAALKTVIRHPELVRKLVLISFPMRRSGWYPEVLQGMQQISQISPDDEVGAMMQQAYAAVAPHPEHWTRLLTKLTRLLGTDYDWSSEIPAIKAPVLYIIGDADSIMLDTAVEFFGLLGGGKLDGQVGGLPNSSFAILPAVLHWDLLTHANLLLPLIPRFLDAPSVIHTE